MPDPIVILANSPDQIVISPASVTIIQDDRTAMVTAVNNMTGNVSINYGNLPGTPNLAVYQTVANNTWANLPGKPTFANVATSGLYSDLTGLPNLNVYLTSANAASTYQPIGNYATVSCLTWSNITGKPTFATVATTGAYSDLSGTPNLSVYLLSSTAASTYYLQTNPSGYITASCLTYSNISGTPNLSLYLTTANAATTYLPTANFSFANLTGKPTTLAGYGITDGLTTTAAASTYATIASLSSYLTTASAASTYLTISSASSTYLTTSTAASTYLTQSSASTTYATLSTNTFTGQQNFGGNILDKPRLQALRESYSSPTISSGTLTLDLSVANIFYTSLNAAITTISITNVPASGIEASFKLELTSDGTARAITWPGSWTFLSGSNPSVPSTNGAKTVLIGYTKDGGTSWSVGSNK